MGRKYYAAHGSADTGHAGQRIALVIDDSLAQASLHATLEIHACTDEDGDQVMDARCPVGQPVRVDISWTSNREVEQLGPPNSVEIHPGRGRQGSASGQIGSNVSVSSTYALIVESQTYQS